MPLPNVSTGLTPIACERLDKDNAQWAKKYLEKLRLRLATEANDDEFRPFLQLEIQRYEELLARFGEL